MPDGTERVFDSESDYEDAYVDALVDEYLDEIEMPEDWCA